MSRKTQVEIIVFKIVKDKVLFLLLKRNEQKGGFWQPVTGGVHDKESLAQTVKRELLEETGITSYLRLISDIYCFEFNTKKHGLLKEYVFGVEVPADTEVKLSSEHVEMKWCSLEDSLTLLKYQNNKTSFKKLFSIIKKAQGRSKGYKGAN